MQLARELFRYFAASALAFALDVSLLWLQVSIFGAPYLTAAAISFLTGTVFLYWASVSRIFGFRRLQRTRIEFAVFLAVGVIGLAINLGIMYACVAGLRVHYLLAKMAAGGCTFLANFAMRRWLLFTPRARAT